MKVKTLEEIPGESEPHVLLRECLLDKSSGGLPEPTWVAHFGENPVTVWSGRSDSHRGPSAVLLIEEPSSPAWEVVLEFWNRYRTVTNLEKALVVSRLRSTLSEEAQRRMADLLDLPPSEPLLNALETVGDFPEKFRERLHEDEVSLRMVRYLNQLPDKVRGFLARGIADGRLGFSVQEIRQLEEAVRRLTDDQRDDWLDRVGKIDEEHPRERGRTVLRKTREMAYPRTVERTERFRETLEDLDLDGRIDVSHPDNFEGDYLDFRFRCRRDDDLVKLSEELKRCKKLLQHL